MLKKIILNSVLSVLLLTPVLGMSMDNQQEGSSEEQKAEYLRKFEKIKAIQMLVERMVKKAQEQYERTKSEEDKKKLDELKKKYKAFLKG